MLADLLLVAVSACDDGGSSATDSETDILIAWTNACGVRI